MGNRSLYAQIIAEIEELDRQVENRIRHGTSHVGRGEKKKRNVRMYEDVWVLLEEVAALRDTTRLRLASIMVEVITKLWALYPHDYELFIRRVEDPADAHAVICIPENRHAEAMARHLDPSETHLHDLRTFAKGAARCLRRGVLLETLVEELRDIDRMVRKDIE